MTRHIIYMSLAASLLATPAIGQESQPALLPPVPAPESAPASAPVESAPMAAPGKFAVGLKFGVVLPQIATELGTTVGGELELSYRAYKGLSIFLAGGYTQPKVSRENVNDPRLDAPYMSETTQQELTTSLGVMYRFLDPAAKWNGYAGLGGRLYFLKTKTEGSVGANPFGENTEQSTKVGGVAMLGGEVRLGPGSLALELQFGDSKLDHLITGDVTTGALALDLGYRFMF